MKNSRWVLGAVAALEMLSRVAAPASDGVTLTTDRRPADKPLLSDPLLQAYLSNGCAVIYTAKTTISAAILEGPFSILDSNGFRFACGTYRDGRWEGELLYWHTNGVLASRQYYHLGREQGGETYWDERGRKTRTADYLDGEKHGLETYWDPDGRIELRIEWERGRPRLVEVFEAGNLKRTATGKEAEEFFRQRLRRPR